MICVRYWCAAAIALGLPGCIPQLPQNVGVTPGYARTEIRSDGRATWLAEEGLRDGVWLQIGDSDETDAVGGYLSDTAGRAALIVVLPGASSFYPRGMIAKARDYHENFLHPYQDAGFKTWTLAVRECGTPYGAGDLADTLAALDWLEQGGRAALGVERVYLLGYSSGATPVLLANLVRESTAVISISGLTQSEDLERNRDVFRLIAALYPSNAGLCQFGTTLRAYGPAGAAAWDALDVVGRVDQLRSPMLVVHGRQDLVYPVKNARALAAAYEQAQARAGDLPPVEFFFVPGGTHVNIFEHPAVIERVLAYLQQFEPDR